MNRLGTHGRKQTGGFCRGDLGPGALLGVALNTDGGLMVLETVRETTYSSSLHALEQGAGGREGGGRGFQREPGAPPRPRLASPQQPGPGAHPCRQS